MPEKTVTAKFDDSVNSQEIMAVAPVIPSQWSDSVDIPADSLEIPWLILVQGNSRLVADEKAKLGQWYAEGFPAVSEVTVVPLKFGMSRRYQMPGADGENVTACYAPTGPLSGLHGIPLLPEGPGMDCAACPMSQWQPSGEKDDRGRDKNSPPPCRESYDFICWSVEHSMPVRIGFRSTGVKAGKLLATLGRTKGLGQFAVRLGSVKATGRFVYAVPTVTILNGDQAQEAIGAGQMFGLPG